MRGFSCMTPQEIFDYKLGWKSYSFSVPFHSDWEMEYSDYCKENFNKWQWDMYKWTNVYEHTMLFEMIKDADKFKEFIDKR